MSHGCLDMSNGRIANEQVAPRKAVTTPPFQMSPTEPTLEELKYNEMSGEDQSKTQLCDVQSYPFKDSYGPRVRTRFKIKSLRES